MPLPPPHGMTAASCCAAAARTAATSSAVPGETAIWGVRPSTAYSTSRSEGAMASPATSERIDSRSAESFAKLAALRRRGEELPRVEPLATEGRPHFRHGGQIGVVEHQAHVVALLQADAVLAGDAAAGLDAQAQDIAGRRPHALGLAGVGGVEEEGG